jgi:L-ectoine synthase
VIVRRLEDLEGTDRDVGAPTFNSRRFLLRDDGFGFSFHDTVLYAGSETLIWYKNHLEAVYCIGGTGELEDLGNGVTHEIRPGTFYALDGHERHYLRATTDLRMMCVFSPPLTGDEVHDDEGTYPLLPIPESGPESNPPSGPQAASEATRRTS